MFDKKINYLKAMQALNGRLIATYDNVEAQAVLEAIQELSALEYEPVKVMDRAFEHCEDGKVKHIIVNKNAAADDIQISLILETLDTPVPAQLDTPEGVFSFVYNIARNLDSELCYIYLQKVNSGSYKRLM